MAGSYVAPETQAGNPGCKDGGPTVIQWVLETASLWPEAAKTKELETVAAKHLNLLTETERQSVLKYVFVRDAKLSLGSSLLKRHLISKYAHIPWAQATPTRSPKGKPIFLAAAVAAASTATEEEEPISFNISHQDGLVVLAAIANHPGKIDVGVDVVSCKERRERDRAAVITDGWSSFVDVYASVFSDGDIAALKRLDGGVDDKLRCFYVHWCAKEAYVKMTGEALLADWIQRLEFRGLRPPKPATEGVGGMDLGEKVGNLIGGERFEVVREDGRDEEVRIEIQSLGKHYMIGTAMRTPRKPDDVKELKLGDYRMFELHEIPVHE